MCQTNSNSCGNNECDRRGIRLYRKVGFTGDPILCAQCAAKEQDIDISTMDKDGCMMVNGKLTKDIGPYVPAVDRWNKQGYFPCNSHPPKAFLVWAIHPPFLLLEAQ